ncbi:DUF262 domain-containing protein [Saccharothrix stipae]
MGVEAFGIEKEFLKDLLIQVDKGEAQLPEFQRGWVWPDRNIASLIASISLGYPAGTVMMLKQGGDVRFKTRSVEGAPRASAVPDRLILDGQQRLTSLYQSLFRDAPVETHDVRGNSTRGWFYIDMEKALLGDGDREEAVVFVPETKIRLDFRGQALLDLSTPEQEFTHRMFPCTAVFNSMQWMMGFFQHSPEHQSENLALWSKFHEAVVKRFEQYQLPVIELGKSTPRQAVCQVFEKVNTGGVTLTVFELLTATFAADDFDLRQDWTDRRAQWAGKYGILSVELPRSRHGRKRDQRAGVEDAGTVRLVRVHARHRNAAPGEREAPRWSSRWPVRAYRRNTCLNSRLHADGGCEHEERIVPAHIKGPADKPLKAGTRVHIWDTPPPSEP